MVASLPASVLAARAFRRWVLVLSGVLAAFAAPSTLVATTGDDREVRVRWAYRFDGEVRDPDSRFVLEAIRLRDGAGAAPIARWDLDPTEGEIGAGHDRSIEVVHRIDHADEPVGYRLYFRQAGSWHQLGAALRTSDRLTGSARRAIPAAGVALLLLEAPPAPFLPLAPAIGADVLSSPEEVGVAGGAPIPPQMIFAARPFVAPTLELRRFDSAVASGASPERKVDVPPPRGLAG